MEEFARERELVHLRHELRQLLAGGRRHEAPPLLERLRALVTAEDAEERPLPELERWRSTFDL